MGPLLWAQPAWLAPRSAVAASPWRLDFSVKAPGRRCSATVFLPGCLVNNNLAEVHGRTLPCACSTPRATDAPAGGRKGCFETAAQDPRHQSVIIDGSHSVAARFRPAPCEGQWDRGPARPVIRRNSNSWPTPAQTTKIKTRPRAAVASTCWPVLRGANGCPPWWLKQQPLRREMAADRQVAQALDRLDTAANLLTARLQLWPRCLSVQGNSR